MLFFTLFRILTTSKGTPGVLALRDPFCLTMEDPWLDNKVGESCIPDGTYLCKRVESPNFGNVFSVMDVPGRTHILIHKGNTIEDTQGCILLGASFGIVTGLPGIIRSAEAFTRFMDVLSSSDAFKLRIRWVDTPIHPVESIDKV